MMVDNKLNIAVRDKLYRKELFCGLRFPEGVVFEDKIITLILLERANRIVMISTPLILDRISRPSNITVTNSNRNVCD